MCAGESKNIALRRQLLVSIGVIRSDYITKISVWLNLLIGFCDLVEPFTFVDGAESISIKLLGVYTTAIIGAMLN